MLTVTYACMDWCCVLVVQCKGLECSEVAIACGGICSVFFLYFCILFVLVALLSFRWFRIFVCFFLYIFQHALVAVWGPNARATCVQRGYVWCGDCRLLIHSLIHLFLRFFLFILFDARMLWRWIFVSYASGSRSVLGSKNSRGSVCVCALCSVLPCDVCR